MLALFVLFSISSSPIAAEVEGCLGAYDNAVGLAGADPSTTEDGRESTRAACQALASAILALNIDRGDAYAERVLGAWRVFDASIVLGGAQPLAPDSQTIIAKIADITALRYEVAQQAAYEAQP